MDIEQQLRGILPLRDPGVAFTDGVMARVADVPVGNAGEGVVRLSEARARKRSRRILFGTVVAIGVAAAMPAYFLRDSARTPAITEAVALVPAGSPAARDPVAQMQAQAVVPPVLPGTGQSPPNCLDPDVLHGLLLPRAGPAFRVSAELPPELNGFKAPRQLSWMGTSEGISGGLSGQISVSAVYRSSLGPEAARTGAANALAGAGWQLHATSNAIASNVFSSVNSQFGDTYCRDGQPVTVMANALDGITYVVLSTTRHAGRNAVLATACDRPPQASAPSTATLDTYLPTLELPRDPLTGKPVPTQGGGSGGSDLNRRMNVSFMLKDSADNVARHFAAQMAAQSWSSEANWSGTGSAGSSWTRKADADTVLQATLVVSAFADGRFTVVFHVVRTK